MVDTHAAQATGRLCKYLTSSQTDGEKVLVVVSSVSLTAVVLLLLIILITALRASYQKSSTNIFRSHVTAYFVSLLVSDLLQAIGSIMNLKWIQDMACSSSGGIKQAADIGTAFWILIIAVHTFNVLVCGIHVRRILMFVLLVAIWSFISALVAMSPIILQNKSKGPYFNISGYWCWISEKYETEQFVLEYMIMFISAVASFILYVLVFLKLRGNLLVAGGRFRFRSVAKESAWMPYQNYEASELRVHMVSVAKHMLLYPIAYMILIVPIAACRFAEWTGHKVPLDAIIFRHDPSPSAFSTPASTTLFRRLIWEGTVPLEIHVDPAELPANSDRGLECYFIQAPRVSYLPLLIPEIKRFLVDIVFDSAGAKLIKEEDWWFETEDKVLMRWHWSIGLLYDFHTITSTLKKRSPDQPLAPLRLILHLAAPPTDKLLLSPSIEACKQAFMGQLKEADFLRWGNTKRMTGLRQAEQDGIWEAIRDHNFDEYWKIASRVTPTTTPARQMSPPPSSVSLHSRPPSADTAGAPDKDGAYNVRSVPIRIYLPDGPVLQDVAPPSLESGGYYTLGKYLSMHLPLLFPSSNRVLAYSVVQGVMCPLEAELAWLGACMAGADGWVNVMIGLV
ncbi:ATG5 [Sanghuangporus vaninii]